MDACRSARKVYVGPTEFRRHLRRQATPAEQTLWERICNKQTGYKITWQYSIEGAYVDFCCRAHRVVIELDGDSHENKGEEDKERDARLSSKGYLVVRFRIEEVLQRPDRVVEKIKQACETRPQ